MIPNSDTSQGRLKGILDQRDFGTPSATLSGAAMRVLNSRYFMKNDSGQVVEGPRELFNRVAWAVAAVEARWSRLESGLGREERVAHYAGLFFELMSSLKFLPNSPTLMNAGRPKGQLSACFVLPVEDDLGRVFETLRDAAIIHKSGGGTGFSFGHIRPAGSRIASSGGTACGPVAFLRLFDSATSIVKQGGTRRGANMAILPVEHPDIEAFIESKKTGGIENFNISVGISNSFMSAVANGGKWALRNPKDGSVVRTVKARKLWKSIAEAAWKTGDPGVVFLDRVNADNPTPSIGKMESTNPCGEQPLLPYESCNLGSLNLLAYCEKEDLRWEELEKDIGLAVRFLDNIIDANSYPLLLVEEITMTNRKIGLGVMGWADVLMEWGIPYDSDRAVKLAEKTMARINRIAIRASEALAAERGAFLGFKKSLWCKRGETARRNATVTTVAPTGTISIIAGVSSGIEPVFSLAYEREALDGEKFVFVHPALKRMLRSCPLKSRKAKAQILDTGKIGGISEISKKDQRVLRTSTEISPQWHVKMQAAFQLHTENGVSKTINLPESATARDVEAIFQQAYTLKCKGITVFRDGSKGQQVLKAGVRERATKGRSKELLVAFDWLLDDQRDVTLERKRVSMGLASLSRSQIRGQKR